MPQITVDYPEQLEESFDRRGFALALHPLVVDTVAATLPACKTRFRRTADHVVGEEDTGHAVLHVGIALLPGRTDEAKAALTEATLSLVGQYVKPGDGVELHASAEVRDLDASYRKG